MYSMLLHRVLVDIGSVRHYYKTLLPEVKKAKIKGMQYNTLAILTRYYMNSDKKSYIDEKTRNDMDTAIQENLVIEDLSEDGGEKASLSVKVKKGSILNSGDFETNLARAALGYSKALMLPRIHYSNALIMFVVKFEEFLSNLYRCILTSYSDQLLAEKTIKYCDLCNAATVESARELLISIEVESFMRKSFSDWCKFFEERKIDLSFVNVYLLKLKEIMLRRNLIVHNKGMINLCYIRNVPESSRDGIKEGSRIEINEEYLEETYTTIEIVVFALIISITKLIQGSNERREHVENVFSSAFDLLEQEEWEQCSTIFQLLLNSEFIDNSYKEMSRVNLWIAKKNINLDTSWKKEVANYDVSALAQQFGLAKAILLDNSQEALQLVQPLYPDVISAKYLKEWPLFKQFRSTPEYERFRNMHRQDFDIQIQDVEQNREVEEEPLRLLDFTIPSMQSQKVIGDSKNIE